MSSDNQPILGVPTNIITGFLGVGKTSAILNLTFLASAMDLTGTVVAQP